ncbi:MAG TPA: aspartate-semialdehyde dehydrogenase [Planctomycetes bacterium]|nr:aspartate-semialdehyde dehydrogenase [Planctomycetota bacterium]
MARWSSTRQGGELKVAVVGASGVVGEEMLRLLESSPLGEESPRVFASSRSAGSRLPWRDGEIVIEELTSGIDIAGIDVALFAAGAGVSKEWAPRFVGEGIAVVDNSSAFRMDPAVALIVPEVNGDRIPPGPAIIANPNCSTTILLLALAPLRELGTFRVFADTYQAVSGAGRAGLDALSREKSGGAFEPGNPFPFPISGNLFPLIGDPDADDGVTTEERKMLEESRKILELPDLEVSVTCVRVPVERCHAIAATLLFEDEDRTRLEGARRLLAAAPGVSVEDELTSPPTPGPLAGTHDVAVGRLRAPQPDVLQMWVVGDQILKGAALNAVQIAERWRQQ